MAGHDARGVEAVEAALGLDQRLGARQPRRGVGKVLGVLLGGQPGGPDVGAGVGGGGRGHAGLLQHQAGRWPGFTLNLTVWSGFE